jgi:hypothetical protein
LSLSNYVENIILLHVKHKIFRSKQNDSLVFHRTLNSTELISAAAATTVTATITTAGTTTTTTTTYSVTASVFCT